MPRILAPAFILPALFIACSGSSDRESAGQDGAATPAETVARPLFDGVTTDGWRGFRQTEVPAGWQVVDSALTRVGEGGDLVTEEQFENFELALEWKVAEGGNSGIMFRVTEDAEWTYHTGPEVQVLDDTRHRDGGSRLTSAGSNYGLHAAPEGVARPAGQWNAVRLVVNGAHVEHWLNGVKVVEYELWTPAWDSLVAASKFAQWPGYGRARKGHIALQDHGDWVAYRHITIRVLP
jgi:hypothetical protein